MLWFIDDANVRSLEKTSDSFRWHSMSVQQLQKQTSIKSALSLSSSFYSPPLFPPLPSSLLSTTGVFSCHCCLLQGQTLGFSEELMFTYNRKSNKMMSKMTLTATCKEIQGFIVFFFFFLLYNQLPIIQSQCHVNFTFHPASKCWVGWTNCRATSRQMAVH